MPEIELIIMLFDNHGRRINYLRLAVTDRCNLRCFYCMPESGIQYVKRSDLLSYEELERIIQLFVQEGITKVRITGGEPFLRKGLIAFLERLQRIEGLQQINITTNGTLTYDLVPTLKALGIHSVNLSLDSLDAGRFQEITRRDTFDKVMLTLEQLLAHDMPTKINAVVMEGKNEEDILPMVELTKQHPIAVRFIEEMPFNGSGDHYPILKWNYKAILKHIETTYPLQKLQDEKNSTSLNYSILGHQGTVGVIPAYSRTFCGTCNRIRLTPQGMLKTCLYDNGIFNIRDLIRNGASNEQLMDALLSALGSRAKDGFEAEQKRQLHMPVSESMATIGG